MHSELGLLASMLEDGTREWREELGSVTQEQISFQVRPGSYSIGTLLLHIAEVEAWWIEQVAAKRELSSEFLKKVLSEETLVDKGLWPSPPREPFEWYISLLDTVREQSLKTIAELNDPMISGRLERWNSEHTFRWILHHVLTHEAYHGGQAVLVKSLCS